MLVSTLKEPVWFIFKKINPQRQITRWLDNKIYSYREEIPCLSILVERDIARRDGKSWSQANFTWEVRHNCSTVRVINQWNRLPREAVDFPFLQVFSSGLDVFVENTFNKHEILGSTNSVKFCCAYETGGQAGWYNTPSILKSLRSANGTAIELHYGTG